MEIMIIITITPLNNVFLKVKTKKNNDRIYHDSCCRYFSYYNNSLEGLRNAARETALRFEVIHLHLCDSSSGGHHILGSATLQRVALSVFRQMVILQTITSPSGGSFTSMRLSANVPGTFQACPPP